MNDETRAALKLLRDNIQVKSFELKRLELDKHKDLYTDTLNSITDMEEAAILLIDDMLGVNE